MKLIVQDTRIVATATDAYTGPDFFIDAPPDFDIARMGEYRYDGGALELPEPTPTACTNRQGRLALLAAGRLADVEAAIAAITDPTERLAAQIEYQAGTWERGNAFLQGMWATLGGTPEQLDNLFSMAVTL